MIPGTWTLPLRLGNCDEFINMHGAGQVPEVGAIGRRTSMAKLIQQRQSDCWAFYTSTKKRIGFCKESIMLRRFMWRTDLMQVPIELA